MKEFKGTKGEWGVTTNEYTGEYFLVTKDGYATFSEDEYNAKLIAAAPELLKALQYLLNISETLHHPSIDFANGNARKAINKALN